MKLATKQLLDEAKQAAQAHADILAEVERAIAADRTNFYIVPPLTQESFDLWKRYYYVRRAHHNARLKVAEALAREAGLEELPNSPFNQV